MRYETRSPNVDVSEILVDGGIYGQIIHADMIRVNPTFAMTISMRNDTM